VLRLVTDRRTDGQTELGDNFIGRQTLELCTEIDHCFIQQSIASVRVIKTRQRSDYVVQIFWYFPFNANISTAAAVAGDSDDSDVVTGDASYVSSSSLLLLLQTPVSRSASV